MSGPLAYPTASGPGTQFGDVLAGAGRPLRAPEFTRSSGASISANPRDARAHRGGCENFGTDRRAVGPVSGSGPASEAFGELAQEASPLRRCHPAGGEPRELLVELRPHEETPELLCRDRRRARAGERVEDEVAFLRGGEQGAAHESQGLLGRVVAVRLLAPGDGRYAPDAPNLRPRTRAVNEVVLEGVAGAPSPAGPQECLVRVDACKLKQHGISFRAVMDLEAAGGQGFSV